MPTGTPRTLDPKFQDEKDAKNLTDGDITPEVVDDDKAEEKEETNNIVYRQNITQPDGSITQKEHGPMPVEDWPAYEKEHNL